MKILVAGATGVLGRALLENLRGHEVLGLTRAPEKIVSLRSLGAQGAVCNVYEPGAFERMAVAFAPELVVNFLTDLEAGPGPANTKIRREGGPIVVAGAKACGARALVVESVAFELKAASGEAVQALEQGALDSGLVTWILRFTRFWGFGTWSAAPTEVEDIEVNEAGRLAAELILRAAPGTYVVGGSGASRV